MKSLLKALAVVACFAAFACSQAQSRGIPVDGYAAVVNDRVITIGEVLSFVRPVEQQLRLNYQGTDLQARLEDAFETGLNTLIERALILEDFEDQEGQIPPKLIDDQVQQTIAERFSNDRAAFLKALEEEQISMDEWREQITERLTLMVLRRREVTDKISVSPTAVRQTYNDSIDKYRLPEKVHLLMITINKGKTPEDEAVKKEEAKGVLEKLEAGEDFGLLARSVSEGSKAVQGGDWGWIEPSVLRAELAAAVRTLGPGEISPVIETEEELYILRVEGRKSASVTSFDEVKEKIEGELRQAEQEKYYNEWIGRLKRKHYVKIYENI